MKNDDSLAVTESLRMRWTASRWRRSCRYIKGILGQQGTVDGIRFRQQPWNKSVKALVAEKNEKVKSDFHRGNLRNRPADRPERFFAPLQNDICPNQAQDFSSRLRSGNPPKSGSFSSVESSRFFGYFCLRLWPFSSLFLPSYPGNFMARW